MGTFSNIPWETSFSMCFSEFFVEGFWRFSFQPGKLHMWWFQKRLNPLLNRQGRGCHYSVYVVETLVFFGFTIRGGMPLLNRQGLLISGFTITTMGPQNHEK